MYFHMEKVDMDKRDMQLFIWDQVTIIITIISFRERYFSNLQYKLL